MIACTCRYKLEPLSAQSSFLDASQVLAILTLMMLTTGCDHGYQPGSDYTTRVSRHKGSTSGSMQIPCITRSAST